jgi:hypothetical protein
VDENVISVIEDLSFILLLGPFVKLAVKSAAIDEY